MRILLDTHTFLWFVNGDPRLSANARRLIEDDTSQLLFSAASAWEIVVKATKHPTWLTEPAHRFIPKNLRQINARVLPVRLRHTLRASRLPRLHPDPFDRLLVAQAQVEHLPLLTDDRQIREYDVKAVW